MRPRVAVLASGTGHTLGALLRASGLRASAQGSLPDGEGELAAEIALVISNRSQSGAAERARQHGVAFRHLSSQTHGDEHALDAAMHAELQAAHIDWIVLAGYLKKLGPCVLETWCGRILNTHPSLLPRFGGAGMYGRRVHEAVLASGAPITGASVHYVTAEYDTGPVIAQVEVPVCAGDDADIVEVRVKDLEQGLLVRVLNERIRSPLLDLNSLPVVAGYVVQPAMPRHLQLLRAVGLHDVAFERAQTAGRLWAVLNAQDVPVLVALFVAHATTSPVLRGTMYTVGEGPARADLVAMLERYVQAEALRMGGAGVMLSAPVRAT